MCHLGTSPAVKIIAGYKLRGFKVQPTFLGKLGLEIGVYQKASPIGGTFSEVSESLRLVRPARRPSP